MKPSIDVKVHVESILRSMLRKDKISENQYTMYTAAFMTGLSVQFFEQDNFTVVTINLNHVSGTTIAVGVSKRHTDDRMNPACGQAIALKRAVASYVKYCNLQNLNNVSGIFSNQVNISGPPVGLDLTNATLRTSKCDCMKNCPLCTGARTFVGSHTCHYDCYHKWNSK